MNGDGRKLIQVIPYDVERIWEITHFRVLMIVSVSFELILMFGNRRKFYSRRLKRILFWIAYSLKLSVGVSGLSVITTTALDGCSKSMTNELMSFWASFMFLHFCASDTIVAYSIEDNELWLRHLGELIYPSVLALFILLLSWPGCSHLPLMSVLVYMVSFIKCFEYVHSLWSASANNLQNLTSGPSDPSLPTDYSYGEDQCKTSIAYNLFQTFKPLFIDHPCEDEDRAILYFRKIKLACEAFHLVETALGFSYDTFFTKARWLYTFKGYMLQVASSLLLFGVSLGFYFLCSMDDYNTIDITITCLLYFEVGLKEVYATIAMLQSDWVDLLLTKHNLSRNDLIFPFLKKPNKRRWSNDIAQTDILSVALNQMTPRVMPMFYYYFWLGYYFMKGGNQTYVKVPDEVKNQVHQQLRKSIHHLDPKALCIHRGSFSLDINDCSSLLWSIDKAQIDKNILTWHIANKLCESEAQDDDDDHIKIHCMTSKVILNYLVNLLVSKPDLMPRGFGITRYRNTCAKLVNFCKEAGCITEGDACRKLLASNWNEEQDYTVEGDRHNSVLADGCTLAIALRKMEKERMWKVISQVSVEMLANVAVQCTGFNHCQQLRRGGEFVTHVWFMIAALGMCKDI